MVHDELPFVLIKQPQRFLAVGDGIAVQKLRLIKKSLVSNQLGFVVLGRFQIFDQMHIHYVQIANDERSVLDQLQNLAEMELLAQFVEQQRTGFYGL